MLKPARSRRCAYDRRPSSTGIPLRHLRRGKVREVYVVDADRLLLVATDRVSAFDVVMTEPIPHKGAVLTQITAWWLRQLESRSCAITCSRRTSTRSSRWCPSLAEHRAALAGRAMLCRRTEVFPVECVVRGYISGSAWKEYREHGTLAGEPLARRDCARASDSNLPCSARRPRPRRDTTRTSPASRMATTVGDANATELERLSRLVYERGREIAAERGIIIADTKFEFGRDRDGTITLIDEVLTPDSSRFWPAEHYTPGRAQPSFDKQPLRDYLDAERRAGRWNGDAPPPALPQAVVDATSARYLDAFRRITGSTLNDALTRESLVNFAREGLSFIVIAALVAAGAFGIALVRRSWPLWLFAFALTLIALWVAYFFRDPERSGERGERLVIAPADGKVVMITEVDEPTFMKERVDPRSRSS